MEELWEKLKNYAASDWLPMHMPGHKRNGDAFPWLEALGCGFDLTEIDGFDNLNDPQTLFLNLEKRCARLWGAGESLCLVNGSTAGNLAAVRAVLERGGELLMQRGSHRSLYHAAEITGAVTRYLNPAADPASGIRQSVTAEEVADALTRYPRVRLVAVTSPTYEGILSDIRSIAAVCHAHGVPLLVDEAHGAHLGFGHFPAGAVRCGADLVVQSLHKTLPSLTQTAVLHVSGRLADPSGVRRNAAIFQSSSPSYLLSAAMDGCVRYLEREGDAAADRWLDALRLFREKTRGLRRLAISGRTEGCFDTDPSKIVISAAGAHRSGEALMALLRERFHVETEMASGDYVVAMTGMGDTAESLGRFAEAVLAADEILAAEAIRAAGEIPAAEEISAGKAIPAAEAACCEALPESRMTIREATASPGEFFAPEKAAGKICGEYIFAYPPGIPILVPGEVIGEETAQTIRTAGSYRSSRGGLPERIFCVRES